MNSSSIGFILTCIFLGCVALTGVFTLFAKAENIERPFLVGGLTLSTTMFAIIFLDHDRRLNFPHGDWMLLLVCVVSVLGFGIGCLVDRLMGPRSKAYFEDSTLGADLAD